MVGIEPHRGGSVVMRKRRVIGAAIAALALLAGMFSAPAAAASSGPRAAESEESYCDLTPSSDRPGETLWIYPVFDPETGTIGGLSAHWVGLFECLPVPTGNAVQEIEFDSTLWYEDRVEIGQDYEDCALIAGDPTCDDVPVSGVYLCDTGVDCAGTYHATYLAHVIMRPGVFWQEIPDYCDEIHPAPLQVVDCFSESNKIVVPATQGD
jgi:hypothetical protein